MKASLCCLTPCCFSARIASRHRGLGLPVVVLLIAALSALVAAAYLEWRTRESVNTARQEHRSLFQADQALITFASVHRRLPCPDTDRDGLEDCAGNAQKGWLATHSLRLAGADPGVGIGQLRYLVQRGGADHDLSVLADDWRPLEYDDQAPATFLAMRDTAAGGGAYQNNILTLADMCQRLESGAAAPLSAGMAQVSATPARAVAYALVHPGDLDADGDGSLFDGLNAPATGHTLEAAQRALQRSVYDDRVLERSFTELHDMFGCQPLVQSINTLALGLDVVDQVKDMREGNIDAATRAVIFAGLGAAITGVELAAAAIEAASDSGNAAAEYAACVASLGIAVNFCSAAPTHTSSAIMAGASAVANGVSVALNITAAALAGSALALADNSQPAASMSCPTIDISGPLQTTQNEVNDAIADRTSIQAEYAAKVAELNAATAAATTAVAGLRTAVRHGGLSSSIDHRVNNLLAAAYGWGSDAVAHDNAAATTALHQQAYDAANDLVIRYNNMLNNRAALITSTEADIAALDAQIAAETDPVAKAALQNQRNNKAGELGLLNNVAVLTAERDKALTDRAEALVDLGVAQAAEANALSARNAALSHYQSQYAALSSASYGPYNMQSAPLITTVACTEPAATPPVTCPAGSVATRANVMSNSMNVLGLPPSQSGASQAHAESKYMRPKRLQREVDALQDKLDAANTRVTDAQTRLSNLQNQLANPPACNISGSGVSPWDPVTADGLLINVDAKGATR